jgi:hypothetical protein
MRRITIIMTKRALIGQTVLLLLATGLIVPGDAFGYIDPGTGSVMFQVLVGLLIGAIATLKLYWAKLKKFLSGLFSGKKDPGDNEG